LNSFSIFRNNCQENTLITDGVDRRKIKRLCSKVKRFSIETLFPKHLRRRVCCQQLNPSSMTNFEGTLMLDRQTAHLFLV